MKFLYKATSYQNILPNDIVKSYNIKRRNGGRCMTSFLIISLVIIILSSINLYRFKNDTEKVVSLVLSFIGILDFIVMVILILIFKKWIYSNIIS